MKNSKTHTESTTVEESVTEQIPHDPTPMGKHCELTRPNQESMTGEPHWLDGGTLCFQQDNGPLHWFAWCDGMFLTLLP